MNTFWVSTIVAYFLALLSTIRETSKIENYQLMILAKLGKAMKCKNKLGRSCAKLMSSPTS